MKIRRTTQQFTYSTMVVALLCSAAHADDDLGTVVVTGTRVAESSADLPMSVDRVSQQRIREGQIQVNLSEILNAVPGVSTQNRQNYAQDQQLSVRGFGARRYALQASGRPGGVSLLANAAHFATDGYRDHSGAERNTFNAWARWLVMAGARNSVVAMKSHNHLPLT